MKYLLSLLAMLVAVNFTYAQNTTWPAPTSSSSVGIGTTTPGTNSKLELLGGGLNIGGNGGNLDASLHIKTSYGGFDRLTQIHPTLAGKPALNLMGSTDANMNVSWWAWGVLPNSGTWAIHPGTDFSGSTGLFMNYNGNVGIGTTIAGAPLTVVNSTPVIQLFDQEFNPGDGSGLGKIAFGSGNEFASIEATRFSGKADDVTALKFKTSWATGAGGDGNNLERMRINFNGNVGIGTQSPDQKLTVNGTIHSSEVKVDSSIPVPDYVFNADYKLSTLAEVKDYISKNHHLPEIPSAAQIENDGLKLGEMNTLLLKKVEELTLHLIEKDQKDTAKDNQLKIQQKAIEQLQQQLESLTKEIHKN